MVVEMSFCLTMRNNANNVSIDDYIYDCECLGEFIHTVYKKTFGGTANE